MARKKKIPLKYSLAETFISEDEETEKEKKDKKDKEDKKVNKKIIRSDIRF